MAIELSKDEIAEVLPSLKRYVREELGEDIGDLKAKLLLDYILREIGPYAYNRGVRDAEAYFRQRLEELPDVCFEEALTYWNKR